MSRSILAPFLSEAVEASRCYFLENWLMKHKWATLVTMQSEIQHQNSQYFYPSEPFTLDHSDMRHPVQGRALTPNSLLKQTSLMYPKLNMDDFSALTGQLCQVHMAKEIFPIFLHAE